MNAPVVVFAVGNRSRGDDALGPLLLERLGDWLWRRGLAARFELFEEYQLQLENALDLEGRELALFIDAKRGAPRAATLAPVAPSSKASAGSTHALEPAAVLEVHRRVTGHEPPPAFALGVRAENFELGEGLSQASLDALGEAWPLLETLAGDPRLESWQALASTFSDEEETNMATRKTAANTKAGTGKAPAAPKEGARPAVAKQPAAKATKPAAAKAVPAAKEAKAPTPAKSPAPAKAPMPAKAPKAPKAAAAQKGAEALLPTFDRLVMVAEAAYYRAERRGFAPGAEMDDWLAAEAEIERLLAGR